MALRSVSSVRPRSRWRRAPVRALGSFALRRLAAALLVRASHALERLAVVVGPAPPPAWTDAALEFVPSDDGRGGTLYADGVRVGRLDGVARL